MIRVALISIFLIGCTAVRPVSQADLIVAGSTQYGKNFTVFYVPSHGALGDSIAISKYKSTGSSALGRDMSNLFSSAENKIVNVVVGGPNSDLSETVIQNAVDMVKDKKLPDLSVHFIGRLDNDSPLFSKFREIGATFTHAEK